jgi:pre-rRNA-processing protein IPI3
MAATSQHLITGSEDSNIHVWSVLSLISLNSEDTHEPLRSLSNHRAAVTAVTMGHSSSGTNICISAAKDQTCIVWNYQTGDLLRTFLLPSTPLCLTLDPCDRAIYVGFEDGTIRSIDLFEPTSTVNTLYDRSLQNTPVQVSSDSFTGAPAEIGAVYCIGLSYDGTVLLSGHASGKVLKWDAGPQKFSAELIDLNAPVTNLIMLSPFPKKLATKAVTVVKPRLGEGEYSFTAQLVGNLGDSEFEKALRTPGVPAHMLEAAILEFSRPATMNSAADDKLKKENEELWAVVNEQRALQKRTYEKYLEAKSST